jgi:hypothetical protein
MRKLTVEPGKLQVFNERPRKKTKEKVGGGRGGGGVWSGRDWKTLEALVIGGMRLNQKKNKIKIKSKKKKTKH